MNDAGRWRGQRGAGDDSRPADRALVAIDDTPAGSADPANPLIEFH